MLKLLRIHNLILIEQAELSFQPGLNVLTGETGSGKSAIMHGLNLSIGGRSDTSFIRRGCDKGIVEAVFDHLSPAMLALLAEGGIDHEPGQELIIRRELSISGKGRIWINHQLAQLAFLRKLGSQLVQMVGQHANHRLFSLEYHRDLVDLYGHLQELILRYQASYDQENQLKQKLEYLMQQEAQRLRDIDTCQYELAEIEEAKIKEGEDEALFAEYSLLCHTEELSTKIHDIEQALTGNACPFSYS